MNTLYSQVWKENIDRGKPLGILLLIYPRSSRKVMRHGEPTLFGSSPLQSLPLKEKYLILKPSEHILTPGQKKWISDLELEWESCWRKVKEIPNPRHANLLWWILNRILPVAPKNVCRCGRTESIKHIFITCPRAVKILKWLRPQTRIEKWDIKSILDPPDPRTMFEPSYGHYGRPATKNYTNNSHAPSSML